MLDITNLEGLAFTGIGADDCFELARKFYKLNFDIEIPKFARPNDWSSDKLDLLRMLPARAGFDTITDWKLKDLRPGDALAVAVGESNPNHLSMYLGDDKILHHLYGQFSRVEVYRDFWRDRTSFLLRHPDVPDLRPVYPDVDLRTLLNVRNSPPTG